MPILNLTQINTAEELERIAKKDLEGKTLEEITSEIRASDEHSRVTTKAGVGYVIEEGYFGIGKNSTAGPDIEHLGVELKTSPLKILKDGKVNVKEPLSLNIINYNEAYKYRDFKDSSLYKKNKKTLLVWYVHDKNKQRSQYLIKYVFLWEMDNEVISELNGDYQMILDYIEKGEAHNIHQGQHKYLTLCPKHNGDFSDPNEMTSKTTQPFSSEWAEVRAFRLKNRYMDKVIYRYLSKNSPNRLDEFKENKFNK